MSNVAISPTETFDPTETPTIGLTGFVDRRKGSPDSAGIERRQFGNSYRDLSTAGRELAEAIDAYKVTRRRRYITTDEMLEVITKLGYRKTEP